MIVILIGLGISEYAISLPFLNEYTARGYFSFFFGVVLGKWLYSTQITKRIWQVSIIVLFFMTLIIIKRTDLIGPATLTVVYYPALIIFFKYPSVEKLFRYKWISTLGRISYDVYIWHSPLFILMYLLIEALQWSVNLNSVSSMLIFALVTFLVGAVSYFCIEKPLDRVVDKYILK